MRVLVYGTLVAAQSARNTLDTKLGLPAPGTNALSGIAAPPNGPGWSLTMFEVLDVTDVNGVYGTAGQHYFLVGPIWPALETRIAALPSPPTIVTAPDALLRKGTRYAARIASWSNGLPVMAETPTAYDMDAVP